MQDDRTGQIAVIFLSRRTAVDDTGYGEAADAMERLAATQPGYRGIVSTRGADGLGITISYWADEAAAIAWRGNAEHAAIRERGRALWYDSYEVIVTQVDRHYAWTRA
ncbi:antibiotic biosynthesis monooxygenase [Sphingomonas sp. Leaf357]|uniref:antibiotic biosynthesis monooxygenase family protein n=1 Tax=Sphingomonas sp. Leaf357 TaxID=1736350 RepID=UPI0006FC222E|nr:antibiotic biosynthesis monooxygenase [Sphingomonas sp. Leaf357]KQS03062.1 antibiotic biosynthesis monooxygenase [Sphingomonas sp. Leaf357]